MIKLALLRTPEIFSNYDLTVDHKYTGREN